MVGRWVSGALLVMCLLACGRVGFGPPTTDDGSAPETDASAGRDSAIDGGDSGPGRDGATGDDGGTPAPVRGRLAVGRHHTCLRLDGRVQCWGSAFLGALGYGSTANVGDDETPASAGYVALPELAVDVAAGNHRTCVASVSGKVWCWGANLNGELGYQDTNNIGDDETLALQPPVDVDIDAIDVAVGGGQSCALTAAGALRCWGINALGYGTGTRIGDDEAPAAAGDVPVGGNVVEIAAGEGHSCALLDTGAVRCWGFNDSGELGYGHTNNIGRTDTPSSAGDVPVGGRVVDLAAGGRHTCAVLSTGAVRCWGSNGNGELGYGNTDPIGDDEFPSVAGDVPLGGLATAVAAGQDHSCALLATGAVRCWGANPSGELGYGHTNAIGDDETPDTEGDVSLGGAALEIGATGGRHTCALLVDGAVRCWGFNGSGQLGYGHMEDVGDDEVPSSSAAVIVGP